MNSENIKISLSYIAVCLLWGSTWIAIRFGLNSLTPVFSAGLRFSLAAVIIYALIKLQNEKIQTDSVALRLYLLMGIFSFVIPFGLVYWAEQYIPSGLASILYATFPFFVIIFTKTLIAEKTVKPLQIIGTVFGFLGILVIFSDDLMVDTGLYFWGLLAMVVSASFQGFITVIIKKYGRHLNSLSMNFFPLLISGGVMTIFGLFFEDRSTWRFDANAAISIGYLSFAGTVLIFTLYYHLLKRINIVILSFTAFISPIIAVLLGFIILGEKLSFNDLLGGFFVLSGILSANLKGLMKYVKISRRISR